MSDTVAAHVAPNNLTIELHADAVEALFHRFDASPLAQRAITAETDAYVFDRVASLPRDAEVSLRVVLPVCEAARCADVQKAFRAHYTECAARQRRLLRGHFREAGYMLLKGMVFALVLISIAGFVAAASESILMDKIAKGLSLIVWVALWRPIDMLIYEWHPIMDEQKIRDRLAAINVQCITSP